MPRRAGLDGPPNSYLGARGVWPEGPFRRNTPKTVLVAATIAARLRDLVAESGRPVTEVADGLGVARTTYYDIVNGRTVPDLHTLVRAEEFLGVTLWPLP